MIMVSMCAVVNLAAEEIPVKVQKCQSARVKNFFIQGFWFLKWDLPVQRVNHFPYAKLYPGYGFAYNLFLTLRIIWLRFTYTKPYPGYSLAIMYVCKATLGTVWLRFLYAQSYPRFYLAEGMFCLIHLDCPGWNHKANLVKLFYCYAIQ